MKSHRLEQTLFSREDLPRSIAVNVCDNEEDCDWEEALAELFVDQQWKAHPDDDDDESPPPIPIGFAPLFEAVESDSPSSPPQYYLCYLAFASSTRVVVIPTPTSSSEPCGFDKWSAVSSFTTGNAPTGAGRGYVLVGFEMPSAVLACFREANLRVVGVDLSVLMEDGITKLPSTIVEEVVGEPNGRQFEQLWRRLPPLKADADDAAYEAHRTAQEKCVAWRAWMSAITTLDKLSTIQDASRVDSEPRNDFTQEDLVLLADLQHQYDLLEAANPQFVVTEYSGITKMGAGEVRVKQAAFKNKARRGKAQNVILRKGEHVVAEGVVTQTGGKETTITLKADVDVDEELVDQIEVHGRGDLTKAEVARNAYMLRFLQAEDALAASPFIRKIWFPTEDDLEDLRAVKANVEILGNNPENDPVRDTELNPSQRNVARAMLADNSFALVHGPPGTGKTRTIAEVVKVWNKLGKKAYLVAQTNVGVKNIAEKLIKEGITEFRILVSNDFYQEWHEAEYNKCKGYMIQSSQFREELKKEMGSMNFVLCTMGMLFSEKLESLGLFRTIPMERLVVDEASQIFVGDYLALFYKFRKDLGKVCWFGDPRQLPPHQREQIKGLKSIYDITHVKEASLLLDTQYRMPIEIGTFVSVAMYNRQLRSYLEHEISGFDCVKFVDVAVGDEKEASTSWVNEAEAQTIVHLVQNYYADLPFVVITPYDSQRKLIEKKLENDGLPGKGKCFNVDSFQGNEEHYVLISCVRTSRTGFLDLHNRINVMLTRAQRGMVIVAKREFVRRIARNTLVGRLSQTWGKTIDLDDEFVEEEEEGTEEGESEESKSGSGDSLAGDEQHGFHWVYYSDVRDKIGDMPGSRGYPRPVSPPKPKAPEQPRVTGFHAVPVAPPRRVWGNKATQPSPPSSSPATLNPKPASPPKAKWVPAPSSTPWSSSGPAIRTVSSAPPTGAWGSKPSIVASTTSRPVQTTQRAKTQPGPTWTISSLPSQTGGNARTPANRSPPNRR